MPEATQLVIAPSKNTHRDAVFTILVAETGEALASHLCSESWHAMGDLYENRPERKEEWGKRFGEIRVSFIDDLDITEKELIRRNKQWYESLLKEEKQ